MFSSKKGYFLGLGAPLTLAILLCVMASECDAYDFLAFSELLAPGGVINQNSKYLRIQEGAIIDITCKNYKGGFLLKDLNAIDTKWFLETASYEVDTNTFPVKQNYEQYASEWIYDSPSYGLTNRVKFSSTIRYTARMEDTGNDLYCFPVDANPSDSFYVSSYTGNYIELVVYPAPTPMRFKSTVLQSWRGGFLGEIDIPITENYNAWKIILKFRTKVYNIVGGPFQIANEPCLHQQETCGDDKGKTWVIYHTYANAIQNTGNKLKLTFVADVWKKFKKGLKAEVLFFGYKIYWHSGAFGSSSSVHWVNKD